MKRTILNILVIIMIITFMITFGQLSKASSGVEDGGEDEGGVEKNCRDLGSSCEQPNTGCANAWIWYGEPKCELHCVLKIMGGIPVPWQIKCNND